MSSLSRRACYKCGDLGHHAEACSSPHRLCYNCKQPSEFSHRHAGPRVPKTNHTAVQTTSRASALSRARPRRSSATTARDSATSKPIAPLCALAVPVRRAVATTASSLATTLYISHPPTLDVGSRSNMDQRACPAPLNPGAIRGPPPVPRGGFVPGFGRGGYPVGQRPSTCYKCGGPNHFARDCQAQAMKCYACGKLGHISRDCTAPGGGPLNTAGKTCYGCGQPGHISRDCPEKNAINGDHIMKQEMDLGGQVSVPPPHAPVA